MLNVVLEELADKLVSGQPVSESEAGIMGKFSAELQRLASESSFKNQSPSSKSKSPAAEPPAPVPAEPEVNLEVNENLVVAQVEPEVDLDISHLEPWQQNLVEVFKQLDADGGGTLDADELRQGLVAAGIPQARLVKVLQIADQDGSGQIDLAEWIRAITGSHHGEMEELEHKLEERMAEGRGSLFLGGQGKSDRCMINPFHKFRMSWDVCIASLCFYIAVILPFVIAFENLLPSHVVNGFDLTDQWIDYVFLTDVLVNFRTGYTNHDGELIMRWRPCALHYLRTWFVLDFTSSFPFDTVSGVSIINLQAVKLLKLGKLIKILKLMKPRNVDIAEMSDVLDDFAQSKVAQMIYRRCSVFVYMLLLCHLMACGMKIIDEGFLENYRAGTDDAVAGSIWKEYLAALYWAMTTLTTVGYGDIIPTSDVERIYSTAAMVIGGGFYGYVVGSITSMVANNDLNASAYYERMDLIQAWLTHHHLPMQMKRVLRRYFKAYLSEKSAVSEADIWHDLSPELQKDVGQYIVHQEVKSSPLFDGLGISSVVRLQSILQRVTILSGRAVTCKGEPGTAMYIIESGYVIKNTRDDDEEHDPQDKKGLVKLGPGQSFGEEVVLGFVEYYTYTVTVKEGNKARLDMIREDEFLNLFSMMPNVLQRMRENFLELYPAWKEGVNKTNLAAKDLARGI